MTIRVSIREKILNFCVTLFFRDRFKTDGKKTQFYTYRVAYWRAHVWLSHGKSRLNETIAPVLSQPFLPVSVCGNIPVDYYATIVKSCCRTSRRVQSPQYIVWSRSQRGADFYIPQAYSAGYTHVSASTIMPRHSIVVLTFDLLYVTTFIIQPGSTWIFTWERTTQRSGIHHIHTSAVRKGVRLNAINVLSFRIIQMLNFWARVE